MKLIRILKSLSILFLLATSCFAQNTVQNNSTGNITATAAGCFLSNSSSCVVLPLPNGNRSSAVFTITGSWTGTLNFIATNAGSFPFSSALSVTPQAGGTGVTSATSNGSWTAQVAGQGVVGIVGSSLSSGSATVTITSSTVAVTVVSSSSGGGITSGYNAQTISYTALASDNGKLITFNGSSLTLTLPSPAPAVPYAISVQNLASTALTVSRNGLNINGTAANLTIAANGGGLTIYTDGTNYFTGPSGACGATGQVQFNSAGACGGDASLTYVSPGLTIGVSNTTNGTLTVHSVAGIGAVVSLLDGTAGMSTSGSLRFPQGAALARRGITWRNAANSGDDALVPSGDTLTWLNGGFQTTTYLTATKCAAAGSGANPSVAACGSAAAGVFSCAVLSAGNCTVNTTAMINANSTVIVTQDESTTTGTLLGVTCNVTPSTVNDTAITAKVAGTSFSFAITTPVTNPDCFQYFIIN